MKLYNYYKNKKVLVTGHTGFKGSWLTLWLLKMNARVSGISDGIPTDPSMFEHLGLEEKIDHHFIDIRDHEPLKEAITTIRPDYIFHLAAQPIVSESYKNPLTTLSTNILGTAHVLEALRELDNDCTAVFITSDKCYENIEQVYGYREDDQLGGKDIYSASKGSAELIIHAYYHSFIRDKKPNIRIASARAGNVIGGGDFSKDRLIPDCVKAWSSNKKVKIRNPESTRPWQHVLEPLSGYLWLAAKLGEDDRLNGESFNFGPANEQNKKVSEIINSLAFNWGHKDPHQLTEYTPANNFREAGLLKLNCDKAMHYLNWKANLDIEKTLEMVSNWYINFYKGGENMFNLSLSQISGYEQLAFERNLSWTKPEREIVS